MTFSILPVDNEPNQTFECSLPIDSNNRRLKFFFSWNVIGEYWQFDLYDQNNDGAQLLSNQVICPIEAPYNNILWSYTYKEIGSLYLVNISDADGERLSLKNLGSDWLLIWGDTPNVRTIS